MQTPSPNPVPDMNRDSFHVPYPLKIKPLSHTSTRDTSLTQAAFLPAYMFMCVYVGTLSFRKAKKTHFLRQIASHIPHSPSIRLALVIFSLLSSSFCFFISPWGALSGYRRHKTLIHSAS
ncbi:hypothetical protein CHARACLAT_029001 [Characodon lateralis]|uniref:Uncharacterized protein n=1 Tax=Characodon lateralis TaxID=208331 RepID=A0ABU7CSY2_9TELE|nr:hypothetical protein [Characodon lateralis]